MGRITGPSKQENAPTPIKRTLSDVESDNDDSADDEASLDLEIDPTPATTL